MSKGFHTACRTLQKAFLNESNYKPTSEAAKLLFQRAGQLEPSVEIKPLPEIQKELNDRYYNNYFVPSRDWCKHNDINWASMKDCLNMDQRALSVKHQKNLQWYIDRDLFDKESNTFHIIPSRLLNNPLNVGDVVLLRSDPSQLCMCVEVPTDVMNPSYTFATVDGQIRFGMRNMVVLRMPSFHRKSLEYLVREENPYLESRVGTVKDSPEKTIILPVLARLLYTSYVPFEITRAAWNRMAVVTKKLELLHRFLQRSCGPWQISIFKLCELVALLDLEKCRSSPTDAYVDTLMRRVGIGLKDCNVGEEHLARETYGRVDAANFLATYWAIVQQQEHNLWGAIHFHKAMLTPISVTVLPLMSRHIYYDTIIKSLKEDNYSILSKFALLVNSKNYGSAFNDFPQIHNILQDYAAGNFHNNGAMITTVSKLFRKLSDYKNRDITRDLCHELLTKLDPSSTINPLLLSDNLAIGSAFGNQSLEKKMYDLATPTSTQNFSARHNFGDMNVYCIDSEEAHEIDDGISIEKKGSGRFGLHIHIADPVTLFGKSINDCTRNEVWKIAFARSFTSYLPDCVIPMLPKTFSKAADLGQNGVTSKTITFSVEVELQGHKLDIIKDSFKVRLGTVSRFPKFTYKSVDQLLANDKGSTQESRELHALHKIAAGLRAKRVKEQKAIVFGEGFNKGLVKLKTDESGGGVKINFEDQSETASNLMVSEMMILANSLAGKYFCDNNIPGVFRCYKELKLKDKAESGYESLRTMTHSKKLPTVKDITKLSSLLNSSYYAGTAARHEMIGAPAYLTVTSPLRRFPDLINHLQLHGHLNKQPLQFTQYEVEELTWHIQSRDVILRKAAQNSASFWTLKYLKAQQEENPERKFSVMITSIPQMGFVRCSLPELSAARGSLKLRPELSSSWAIGDVVHNCKITKLDCLDGVMELEV
ncbi:LANO_0F14356g1_1 [Lachancea nothofagi CBS 11611]|uniref:LANO_0F14356g1_1 n=1 Tax=Lachancea nothofagi CBS 11611 TaxID=1266666 RepID=A0A1G4KC77_9SACH|nr:LANO_0F14356g1_1 [Lachancea nothofagi CBS 11611]